MGFRVRSVRYADKSIYVAAANKQGATELDSRVKESELKFIYAQF